MIRTTLTGLLLGLLLLPQPRLTAAETNTNSKKPPQKPTLQIPEPTPPSKTTKLKKYRSLNTFHPHPTKGRGPGKSTRPGTT